MNDNLPSMDLVVSRNPKQKQIPASRIIIYIVLFCLAGLFLAYFKINNQGSYNNKPRAELRFYLGDKTRQFERELPQSVNILQALTEVTASNNINFSYAVSGGKIDIVELDDADRLTVWKVYVNGALVSRELLDKYLIQNGDRVEVKKD